MDWNPLKAADRVLDKGSNVFHKARNGFNGATRAVRRTASSAVNTARREIGETSQTLRRTSNSFVNTARREFNDTTRAVKKTTNSFANTARREFNDTTRAVKKTTNIAVNTARREVGETSQALKRTSANFASTARREFNETTQTVRRTTNNVADTARREFNDTTRAVRRTASSAVNTARREISETSQALRRTSNSFANTARREVGETSQALRRTTSNFASTARREFNETTQAASRITNRAVDTVRQANWRDVGHTVLDGAGFIPVVGAVADVANGAWYAAEGDWKNAAFSFGAAVPGAGDAVAAAKGATRIAEAANAVGRATNVAGIAEDGVNGVRSAAQGDWRSAGVALGSTVLGGVNTPRVPRRPGTVANVTGDAGDAGRRLAIEAGPRRLAIRGPRVGEPVPGYKNTTYSERDSGGSAASQAYERRATGGGNFGRRVERTPEQIKARPGSPYVKMDGGEGGPLLEAKFLEKARSMNDIRRQDPFYKNVIIPKRIDKQVDRHHEAIGSSGADGVEWRIGTDGAFTPREVGEVAAAYQSRYDPEQAGSFTAVAGPFSLEELDSMPFIPGSSGRRKFLVNSKGEVDIEMNPLDRRLTDLNYKP